VGDGPARSSSRSARPEGRRCGGLERRPLSTQLRTGKPGLLPPARRPRSPTWRWLRGVGPVRRAGEPARRTFPGATCRACSEAVDSCPPLPRSGGSACVGSRTGPGTRAPSGRAGYAPTFRKPGPGRSRPLEGGLDSEPAGTLPRTGGIQRPNASGVVRRSRAFLLAEANVQAGVAPSRRPKPASRASRTLPPAEASVRGSCSAPRGGRDPPGDTFPRWSLRRLAPSQGGCRGAAPRGGRTGGGRFLLAAEAACLLTLARIP
jgi:hypothetical protein